MAQNTRNKRIFDDPIVTAACGNRRSFLRLLGGGVLGATGVAAGLGRAEAQAFEPLWSSAQVFIGNSPADQSPSPVIQCPLFFENGHFASAFHTLDLSDLSHVTGGMTSGKDTIQPDLSSSVAVTTTVGTDGIPYLLVAGEGTVRGGPGYFRGVTKGIVRCKYKLADPGSFLAGVR
jgi:hypothetical protein